MLILPGIALRIGNEVAEGLGWNRWVHHQNVGLAADPGNRCDVADEIEIELLKQRGVDRIRRNGQQERVAIGRGVHDGLGGQIAAGPRAVFDDEWLTEPLLQPLPDAACEHISRPAGRKTDDNARRPAWVQNFGPSQT
jgi:hypothetical protein